MKVTVQPSNLGGVLRVPASKSVMQRACAAALISKGDTLLGNPGSSADDEAALSIITALGATVRKQGDQLLISSPGLHIEKPLTVDCGESGLSIRMFTPIAACLSHAVTLTGQGSLVSRPMHFFDEVLPSLGVVVCTTQGKLPIGIQGPLRPMTIRIDGSLSSQFLTGLLFAYAAAGARDVSIYVDGLVSKPYIDLTLSVMQSFGLSCPENKNYQEFYFGPAVASPSIAYTTVAHATDANASLLTAPQLGQRSRTFWVEADWSSASFLLVAGALAGTLRLQGLDLGSCQSDLAILQALDAAGVAYAIEAKGIVVHRSTPRAFSFDATSCPDLFPPLVALAAYAKGESLILGANRLLHKESNRAQTLMQEFAKMGVTILHEGDRLVVQGTGVVQGAAVSACGDHRIAMALAVAALAAVGSTEISGAEAIKKSYPAFFADLSVLGASVSLPHFN